MDILHLLISVGCNYSCLNFIGGLNEPPLTLGKGNYIPLFYVNVITYPNRNLDANLVNFEPAEESSLVKFLL